MLFRHFSKGTFTELFDEVKSFCTSPHSAVQVNTHPSWINISRSWESTGHFTISLLSCRDSRKCACHETAENKFENIPRPKISPKSRGHFPWNFKARHSSNLTPLLTFNNPNILELRFETLARCFSSDTSGICEVHAILTMGTQIGPWACRKGTNIDPWACRTMLEHLGERFVRLIQTADVRRSIKHWKIICFGMTLLMKYKFMMFVRQQQQPWAQPMTQTTTTALENQERRL